MGHRRDRLNKRQANATATRQVNSMKKIYERRRRDEQMFSVIKAGSLPYTAGVMSWLSERLEKKASQIESKDVKGLLKG